MLWFNRGRRNDEQLAHEVEASKSTIEIRAHQRATKRTVAQTKKVNKQLNELFDQNGITLQIKIAVGGKH